MQNSPVRSRKPTDERMLHSDAFAWYMEKDPVLRSTVVAVVRLESVPDWQRLRARIDRLTRIVPKLRMRVQAPPLRLGPPRWILDDSFDLDYHLRRERLNEPADWPDVLEFARRCAMDDFDRSRPLWEFTLLEGLADGGAAFVTKLHHSLTDGLGGVQLATLVVDLGPSEPPLGPLPDAPDGAGLGAIALTAKSIGDDAREAVRAFAQVLRFLPGEAARTLRHPHGSARDVLGMVTSVVKFVAPINAAASKSLGTRRTRRVLETLDIPLDALHDAAVEHHCTLNDAYLAALVAGVRRYHLARGEDLSHLRITVPVSLRTADDPIGGNRITLTRMTVPVIEDTRELMHRISDVVRRWRHEPALDHAQEIAFGLNLVPRPYIGGVFKRVELLASDVPGLTTPVWLAGAKVTGYYAFGPTIGAAFNATLMSYAGTCNIGLNVDSSAVTDPEAMLACVQAGFADVIGLRGLDQPMPNAASGR